MPTTALSRAITAAVGTGPEPKLVTKEAAKAIMAAANADGVRTEAEAQQLDELKRAQMDRFDWDAVDALGVYGTIEYITIGLNTAILEAAANGQAPNVIDASEADAIVGGAIRSEGDLNPEELQMLRNLIGTAFGGPASPDSGFKVTAEAAQRLAELVQLNRSRWTFPSDV